MVEFNTKKKKIIATYYPYENSSTAWIFEKFKNNETVVFNKVYNFKKENLEKEYNSCTQEN